MTAIQEELEARLANYKSVAHKPMYNKRSDCLTYLAEDVEFHTQRVDDILTVYLARDDGRLVGFNLKGVSLAVKNYVTFVGITDGNISFGILLCVAVGYSEARKDYVDVCELVKGVSIPASEFQATAA